MSVRRAQALQELLGSTRRWLLNAQFSLMTFKIRISMAIYPENVIQVLASFLFTESHVLSLGLKCTDRSQWSLATMTSGHSYPSILGATAIVQYQPWLVFPLADVLSLIGSLCQNWPCKHFMQHFMTSLPDWYVAAESRTTTSICSEEWCIGVVLAMTSTPICLKSSQVSPGQLLLPTNLKPLKLYVEKCGKQLSRKMSTMWNRSALVEVLCCYWQSGLYFRDLQGAAPPLSLTCWHSRPEFKCHCHSIFQ